VNYRGTLDNGEQFDSTYARGEPAELALSDVIPGWAEGLKLIGEGGMIELEIPALLGYGRDGKPPRIPPNAKLHFIIELMEVK
jgi:FKBP-type peptidyl-prolyl cis-trans isomerase